VVDRVCLCVRSVGVLCGAFHSFMGFFLVRGVK